MRYTTGSRASFSKACSSAYMASSMATSLAMASMAWADRSSEGMKTPSKSASMSRSISLCFSSQPSSSSVLDSYLWMHESIWSLSLARLSASAASLAALSSRTCCSPKRSSTDCVVCSWMAWKVLQTRLDRVSTAWSLKIRRGGSELAATAAPLGLRPASPW